MQNLDAGTILELQNARQVLKRDAERPAPVAVEFIPRLKSGNISVAERRLNTIYPGPQSSLRDEAPPHHASPWDKSHGYLQFSLREKTPKI